MRLPRNPLISPSGPLWGVILPSLQFVCVPLLNMDVTIFVSFFGIGDWIIGLLATYITDSAQPP